MKYVLLDVSLKDIYGFRNKNKWVFKRPIILPVLAASKYPSDPGLAAKHSNRHLCLENLQIIK